MNINPNHAVLLCQESPILKIPVHGTTNQSFGEIFLHVGRRKIAYLKGFTSDCVSDPKKYYFIELSAYLIRIY